MNGYQNAPGEQRRNQHSANNDRSRSRPDLEFERMYRRDDRYFRGDRHMDFWRDNPEGRAYPGRDMKREYSPQGPQTEGSSQGRGHYGKGPKGYIRSDSRIHEEVCERLTQDPHLDASEVEVEVKSGEVWLTGLVSNRQEKRRAEDLSESILGVKEVHNNIRVTNQAPQDYLEQYMRTHPTRDNH